MTWIKSSEQLPASDQWCWVYISGKYVERAVFDSALEKWIFDLGVYIMGLDEIRY